MNREININEEKKKRYALVISLLVLMICIVGSTYAYFALTASNNSITGKVGGTSLNLTVTKVLPIDNDSAMIPQLEGGLEKAISEEYNCVDGNGKVVCQVYSATITNDSGESVTLNGTISFTGIENMPNLKWKLLTDSRTIDSEASTNSASTDEVTFVEDLTLTIEESTKSSTYYFVFWIEETKELQTDNGEFRATINFNSPNATSGITSTIIPNEGVAAYGAAKTIIDLYNSGEEADYKTVNIGGDTSKPTVTLNTKQKIMLDNNGEYRYYGNETTEDTANGKYLTKNYVSFNGELWRIISSSNVKTNADDTTGSQRLRIIRAESIGNHAWDADTDGDWEDDTDSSFNNWENATLNTTLNGIYYNGTSGTCYLDGSETTCDYSEAGSGTIKGLSSEARSLIDDAVWYLGGSSIYEGLYASDYYTFERGTTVYEGNPTSTTAKLGIMYPSDYAYAADLSVCKNDGNNYSGDATNCAGTDWLFNNEYQWLVSSNSGYSSVAFYVGLSGFVHNDDDVSNYVNDALGVRPVAVLKPNVEITGGEGTSGDPYQLTLSE